ncbi:hypothetical protein C2S52_021089 [Perilla frutescens var. hirtella]|nr:hypothetical protein C2S52_021089 [Perilla frutescens var. hirtella]
MKRASKIAVFRECLVRHRFSLYNHERITKPSAPIRFICQDATRAPSSDGKASNMGELVSIFANKLSYSGADAISRDYLSDKVAELKKEILAQKEDVEKIEKILLEDGLDLFRRYSDGSAAVHLLKELHRYPSLAMEVLGWRRKQLDHAAPMTVEEYSKGIDIASKMDSLDVAVELFKEASNKGLKDTSLFNALMCAYTRAGSIMKCQSVFHDLKRESTCAPTIISYNILLSSFGRMMLVDHMEATFRELNELNLAPTIYTYKGLISGYITAWMWEEMEKTYLVMEHGPVKPDLDIYLLMLRGYALAGKLEKMEEIYDMVSYHVDVKEYELIRVMIRAYCRSSNADKVQKVEELYKKIPEKGYRPWLHVVLIQLYANEDLLEQMENSINEAFERKVYITTSRVMRCITATYFRHNAVDKLADFGRRAEIAGWKLCRSLYHCKMVMYGSEMRLSEMERVLDEMDRVNMHLTGKTLWILCCAYENGGERSKLEQVIGIRIKNGYKIRDMVHHMIQ